MNRNIKVPSYPHETRPSRLALELYRMDSEDISKALQVSPTTARAILKSPERMTLGQLARIMRESIREPAEILADLLGLEELRR